MNKNIKFLSLVLVVPLLGGWSVSKKGTPVSYEIFLDSLTKKIDTVDYRNQDFTLNIESEDNELESCYRKGKKVSYYKDIYNWNYKIGVSNSLEIVKTETKTYSKDIEDSCDEKEKSIGRNKYSSNIEYIMKNGKSCVLTSNSTRKTYVLAEIGSYSNYKEYFSTYLTSLISNNLSYLFNTVELSDVEIFYGEFRIKDNSVFTVDLEKTSFNNSGSAYVSGQEKENIRLSMVFGNNKINFSYSKVIEGIGHKTSDSDAYKAGDIVKTKEKQIIKFNYQIGCKNVSNINQSEYTCMTELN